MVTKENRDVAVEDGNVVPLCAEAKRRGNRGGSSSPKSPLSRLQLYKVQFLGLQFEVQLLST